MRVEQEASRRSNGSVVLSTILSLLVVVAAVAVVAWLVLRSPSTAVDSAERLDPVGTALPAPTEPPALPTLAPTEEPEREPEPEPTALGFTGESPAVAGLPTVAAPQEPAGPTPTPRVIAQPTEIPPTPLPPAPTLPPSVPVEEVPVVALQPVEVAPAPTSAPAQAPVVSQPTPAPAEADDDPFNIFDEVDAPRIMPSQDDPLARVREMQEERENEGQVTVPAIASNTDNGRRGDDDDEDGARGIDTGMEIPAIVSRGGQPDPAIPDVDAMIDEITARATDPNRNPNVGDAGRRVTARDDEDDEKKTTSSTKKRRKSAREIIQERTGRTPASNTSGPSIVPRPGNGGGNNDDCKIGDPGFPFC